MWQSLTTQEVLTTNFRSSRTAKLNNSKALSIMEEGSVTFVIQSTYTLISDNPLHYYSTYQVSLQDSHILPRWKVYFFFFQDHFLFYSLEFAL